jgi:hypothetical protein
VPIVRERVLVSTTHPSVFISYFQCASGEEKNNFIFSFLIGAVCIKISSMRLFVLKLWRMKRLSNPMTGFSAMHQPHRRGLGTLGILHQIEFEFRTSLWLKLQIHIGILNSKTIMIQSITHIYGLSIRHFLGTQNII